MFSKLEIGGLTSNVSTVAHKGSAEAKDHKVAETSKNAILRGVSMCVTSSAGQEARTRPILDRDGFSCAETVPAARQPTGREMRRRL